MTTEYKQQHKGTDGRLQQLLKLPEHELVALSCCSHMFTHSIQRHHM